MKEGDGNKPREKAEGAKRKGGLPAGGEDVKAKKKREVRGGPPWGRAPGGGDGHPATGTGAQHPHDGSSHPGMGTGTQEWGQESSIPVTGTGTQPRGQAPRDGDRQPASP